MNRIYAVLFFLFLLSCSKDKDAAPAKDVWIQKTDFPGAGRIEGVKFSLNGVGYVVAGTAANNTILSEVWAYTPATDSWTKKANIPVRGPFEAAFVLGGKAYVFNAYADVYEYTPELDQWVFKSAFPDDIRQGVSSFVIGDAAYVGMGYVLNGQHKKDFWKYQLSTNAWTRVADFPGDGRIQAVAFADDKLGYVGLGLHDVAGTRSYVGDFWSYNPTLNTWAQLKAPPISDAALQASDGGTAFYMAKTGFVKIVTSFYAYDATANSWTEMEKFPNSNLFVEAFTIDNSAYTIGGLLPSADMSKQVYQFTH